MYFDIGANRGLWSIANLDKTDRIIAVEAAPKTYDLLKEQVAQYPKIVPLHYAVTCAKEPEVPFQISKDDTLSSLNKDWLTDPNSRFFQHFDSEIRVKTITLDKLIEIQGMPSLIKIDVEAAESEVVRSLTQKVDCLCFEWTNEFYGIVIDCISQLHELGFHEFHIQIQDAYNYRPTQWTSYEAIFEELIAASTQQTNTWGMIWCR